MRDEIVSCGSCRACCRGDAIVLHPEHGDDPSQYETEEMPQSMQAEVDKMFGVNRGRALILKRAENGDCLYLSRETGCTIYERRPAICREFNCAKMVDKLGLEGLKKVASKGLVSQEVLTAGIARLPRPARRRLERSFAKARGETP